VPTLPTIPALALGADADLATGVAIGVLGATVAGVALWLGARARRRSAQPELPRRRVLSEQERHAMNHRDEKLFAQHSALNDLTAEKLRLEAQYLQLQTDIARKDLDARSRMDAYHDLMTQKAQLEVQSLRLHIREQRKRLDDFTNFDDD